MASDIDKVKFKSSNDSEETILLFTNGKGEPKAVNVDRCLEELPSTGYVDPILDDSVKNDFLYACPRVHMLPISFEFGFDSSRSSTNFEYVDGFQFSYQVVYRNGSSSSLAPYSDIAIPPSIIGLGASSLGETDVENVCFLFIPKVSDEVRSIRLIVREGNDGNPRVIDEFAVDVENDSVEIPADENFSAVYTFYNDRIGTILSEIDAFKTFDNVPRQPKAQAVADNRVMYGNYKEGYPNMETDVQLSVEFKQAPPPGYSFDLKVIPYLFNKSTNKIDEVNGVVVGGGDRIKTNSGFLLDTSGFPENIPPGSYTVDITLTPKNNFHLFYGMGDSECSRNNIDQATINAVVGVGNTPPAKARERGAQGAGIVSQDKALGKNAFDGADDNSTSPTWLSTGGASDRMDVGNSYSSPLIFKGEPISISTTINTNTPVPRDQFSLALMHGLCGLNPNSSPISGSGVQEFPLFNNADYFKEVSYDLGLSDDSQFSADDTNISDLVTSWSETNLFEEDRPAEPRGFFVVNKAKMRFVTEPAKEYDFEDSTLIYKYGGDKSGYGIIVSFAHATEVECKTVIPIPEAKWASAAAPNAAAQTQLYVMQDPANNAAARRKIAMGTGSWDWRDDNGTRKISWPSCRRMWKTPDGTMNGPSFLQHTNPSNPSYGDFALSDQGVTLPLAGANVSGSQNATLSVQVPGDEGYHPAPIDRWLVVGGSSSDVLPSLRTDQAYWNSKGFRVNCDVPHGASTAGDFLIEGQPKDMLGDISEYYCGYFTEQDGNGYFKLGRDIPYSLPSPSVDPISYAERGTFSLIDGDFGPGGMEGMGAERYGNRKDNSLWGDPLAYGYHSGSNLSANGFGRMANGRGSVTNFSLLGFRDNLPGLTSNEVINRNASNNPAMQQDPFVRNEHLGTSWTFCRFSEGTLPNEASAVDPDFWGTFPNILETVEIDDRRFGNGYYPLSGTTPAESFLVVSALTDRSPQNLSRGASMPISGSTLSTSSELLGYTSYKTKANHEFGIVYYDERGRHGAVQPAGSVYVPGYDDEDRGGLYKGGAKVVMEIFHQPPSWAKHYRIVYGGNTSVSEFIQYTAENAFVPASGPDKNRIYVSLNHLQGNEISYAEGYGAISQDDNSKDLYKFAEGDRLRIINYSDAAGNVVSTPSEFDFRIVSLEILAEDMEDHVFPEGAEGNPRYNGEFLVLENNSDAEGFSVFSINNDESLWGNRCLFEIYRPFKAQGEEARRYFETNYGGEVYPAENGQLTHQYNTIKMSKGDVFFRSTPMNVQTLSEGTFTSLLPESDAEGSPEAESNFVPYYIETEGITDLYQSKSKSFGRVHFADRFANEVLRESSISFSEQTSQGSYDLRYFSFPQIGNFKDLPPVHGGIDYMSFEGTHIMSFNNSKLYRIPVSRDVLQTGAEDAIVASTKVLGTETAIPFDGGSSGRPESVVSINNDFFFFDAINERLVMVSSGKTPLVITDINTDSYFREEVKKWKAEGGFKAPIGYDPSRSELIFSLHSDGENLTNLDYNDARDKMITIAFDLKSKKYWKTRYTFTSSHYTKLKENLVSFHNDLSLNNSPFVLPWIHDRYSPRNKFFGQSQRSTICIASNENPSKVKEYNVIILDSDSRWEANMYTKTGSAIVPRESFKRYNDKWYSAIDAFVPTVSGGGVNRAKSADTSLRTAPILESNKNLVTGSVLNTQFLGPKYFTTVPNGEIEIRLPMPKTATIFKSPIPAGPKSKIYESVEGDPNMYEIGHFGVHGLELGAYIHGTEKHDASVEDIIVRMPLDRIVNFSANNGMMDVVERIAEYASDGDVYALDQTQNDVTGRRIFDLIFAPFYSTKFGVGAEELEDLSLFVSLGEGQSPGDAFVSEFEYDFDNNGLVSTEDLLTLLSQFGNGVIGTNELLELLVEFGQGELIVEGEDGSGVDPASSGPLAEGTFNSLFQGVRKNLHIAYQPSLNTQDLTGRYLKVELVSDNFPDEAELFEVGIDYDTRVKSVSRAKKPVAKKAQTKKK